MAIMLGLKITFIANRGTRVAREKDDYHRLLSYLYAPQYFTSLSPEVLNAVIKTNGLQSCVDVFDITCEFASLCCCEGLSWNITAF